MESTNSTNADYEELKRDYKELKEKYQEEVAKNVQTSLIQNRGEYLQSILDTTHDGFWVVNNKGIITDVNDSYCRMSGYSRSEIIGMKISDLDVDETPEETKARIERIVTNGSETFCARHLRKDGSILSVEISVSYQKENGDKICFCRDTTEQKLAQEALQGCEQNVSNMFVYAAIGMAFVSLKGKFNKVNPVFCKILGYDESELLEKTYQEITYPR
jgi:PAS domain S-box-containing protein